MSNLCATPGFETAGGGDPDFFTNWTEAKGNGAIADDAAVFHGGAHSAKLTTGADHTCTLISAAITVTPGKSYWFRVWSYGDTKLHGRIGVLNAAETVYLTNGNVLVETPLAATWHENRLGFVPKAADAHVHVFLAGPYIATGVVNFDDVVIQDQRVILPRG
jgi:hypothetical protein